MQQKMFNYSEKFQVMLKMGQKDQSIINKNQTQQNKNFSQFTIINQVGYQMDIQRLRATYLFL
jgi:hypothetical protein